MACLVAAILAAAAIPVATAAVDRSRAWAAARYVAARMARARALAASRSATVALRFEGVAPSTSLSAYVDGNHNGVLSRDIDLGFDTRLEDPVTLANLFPGVRAEFEVDAVRSFSFTPQGTATGATVYLAGRDGSRFAVRVLAATARVRVLRYVAQRDAWVEGF